MFWTDIARFLQYFRNLSNSFVNTFAILKDFIEIFSKYSFNITVLCGKIRRRRIWPVHRPYSGSEAKVVAHLALSCTLITILQQAGDSRQQTGERRHTLEINAAVASSISTSLSIPRLAICTCSEKTVAKSSHRPVWLLFLVNFRFWISVPSALSFRYTHCVPKVPNQCHLCDSCHTFCSPNSKCS